MNWRTYLFLYVIGLLAISLVAAFQNAPGYMDADYYYAGGVRLADGYGFTEAFLWNYLDDPTALPHPSHAYWMPLASIIAAIGMKLASSTEFWVAKLAFIFIGGMVSPLTASLAYAVTQRKDQAILAGLLGAVPGFYLSYLGTTDTFGIYMCLGALWFLLVIVPKSSQPASFSRALTLGIISGLFHLARADGILWIFMAGVAMIYQGLRKAAQAGQKMDQPADRNWLPLVGLALGYLVVMGPWMARNLDAFGTPLSPGGNRMLWLTEYDELFSYPANLLTPERWLASGLPAIFRARWDALRQNLQSAMAVQGEIFLVPLILSGLWYWRKDLRVQLGLLAWALTLLVMTLVFPFAGWRGGFFHSGAAFQPLFWSVVPAGLDMFIGWGKRVRRWDPRQAGRVFGAGLVGLAILLSLLIAQKRVIGHSLAEPTWEQGLATYTRLEDALGKAGIEPGDVVMVNNAPGYYVANRRAALTIPNGGVETSLEVGKRYGADYLLLESNHPAGVNELYKHPTDLPGLRYLNSFEGTHIFVTE
jgi:hypothetical protein